MSSATASTTSDDTNLVKLSDVPIGPDGIKVFRGGWQEGTLRLVPKSEKKTAFTPKSGTSTSTYTAAKFDTVTFTFAPTAPPTVAPAVTHVVAPDAAPSTNMSAVAQKIAKDVTLFFNTSMKFNLDGKPNGNWETSGTFAGVVSDPECSDSEWVYLFNIPNSEPGKSITWRFPVKDIEMFARVSGPK